MAISLTRPTDTFSATGGYLLARQLRFAKGRGLQAASLAQCPEMWLFRKARVSVSVPQ